ncbi:hypothetical protein D3C86_1827100 [compost metagenome]
MARKQIDSGSMKYSTGSITKGAILPTKSRPLQPSTGSSKSATQPPSAIPKVKPEKLKVTSNMRQRMGEYSDTRVMQPGNTPPNPMPVSNRSATSTLIDEEKA